MMQRHGVDTSIRIECPPGYDSDLWDELCTFQRYTIEQEKEFLETLLANYPTISDQFRYAAICEFLILANCN